MHLQISLPAKSTQLIVISTIDYQREAVLQSAEVHGIKNPAQQFQSTLHGVTAQAILCEVWSSVLLAMTSSVGVTELSVLSCNKDTVTPSSPSRDR